MMKHAPGNVRYLGYFGEHILTRSFTARDPFRTSRFSSIPLEFAQHDVLYNRT